MSLTQEEKVEPEKNVRQRVGEFGGQARMRGSDMSARNDVSQSAAAEV
jgi:hypothetical protein